MSSPVRRLSWGFVVSLCLSSAVYAQEEGVRLRSLGVPDGGGPARAVVVESGALVHTALILPGDRRGVAPSEDAEAQARDVFDSLAMALREARTDLQHLVRLHVYVADASVTPAVDRVFAERFPGLTRPALTLVESAMPRRDVLVAMDAVAATDWRPERTDRPRLAAEGLRLPVAHAAHVAVQPDGPFVVISGRAAAGAFDVAIRDTMAELRADLSASGLTFADVVQVKTFLADMARADEAQRLVAEVFQGTAPPQVVTEWHGASQVAEIELVATGPASQAPADRVTYVEPVSARFSRAARVSGGRPIYISGLSGTSPEAGQQVHQLFADLGRIVVEAGSNLRHLVKATYYVSDPAADREINVVRPTLFDPARPPAASKISVRGTGRAGIGTTIDMIAVTLDR